MLSRVSRLPPSLPDPHFVDITFPLRRPGLVMRSRLDPEARQVGTLN
jgi:hypothetical protein